MPDFVVIGAAKAGTTTLHAALEAHPGVFVAPGEPGFWACLGERTPRHWPTGIPAEVPVRSAEAYAALFADAPATVLRGEVCPLYLESPVAPTALSVAHPDCRVAVSLRDPVDRAWSSYWMHVRGGLEDRPPQDAFGPEEHRVQVGRYRRNLLPWVQGFERILPLWFEDWTRTGLQELATFLEMDALPLPPAQNPGGRPRNALVKTALGSDRLRSLASKLPPRLRDALKAGALAAIPPMPDDVRMHLQTLYADEAEGLEDLLGVRPSWNYTAP